MTAQHRRRSLVAVLALSVVTACGGEQERSAAPSPSAAPTTASPAPPPPAPPPVDPLTGSGTAPATPLVALKIDNAPLARPFHRGLEGAAVLYVELVEGGATRFVGLYSQPFGGEVGPLRSFRESDIELLSQYGRAAVGFSGANEGVLRSFRAAVDAGQLANAGYDDNKDLYRIGERRKDAKNFYAVPDRLAQAPGATPAKDLGWRFADAPPAGAVPAATARVVMSDRSALELRFDQACGCYAVLQDGQALPGFTARNVLVQQVPVRESGYRDVTGAPTPYSVTVGSGTVDLLRGGTRTTGQWSRPDVPSATRWTDPAGADLVLAPGPTLVVLQPAGLPFSTG